jgi:ABC-2 type transport system permease protein
MLDTIKSDIRKLFTVRSTYILLIVGTILATFVAFYVEAFWGKSGSPAGRMSLKPFAIHEVLAGAASLITTFLAIIAILQVGHEYRYNTIMYTLTASPSRLKVYLSKLLTLSIFSLLAGSLCVLIALGAYILGLSIKGAELPVQDFRILPELARMVFYLLAYGVLGVALGLLVRSLIVAITIIFIVPSMIEPLLGMVLHDNAKYLPISSLDQVMNSTTMQGAALSHNTAILVSGSYLLVLAVVALVLFLRRDAN